MGTDRLTLSRCHRPQVPHCDNTRARFSFVLNDCFASPVRIKTSAFQDSRNSITVTRRRVTHKQIQEKNGRHAYALVRFYDLEVLNETLKSRPGTTEL